MKPTGTQPQSPQSARTDLPSETPAEEILDLGDSPASALDDDLWLEYGRKLVQDGPATLRSAATAWITGIVALQGIYLGILSFAKFIPENTNIVTKFVFTLPVLAWMGTLYQCLLVVKLEPDSLRLHAPDELRQHYVTWLSEKQRHLDQAYWWLFGGMMMALYLVLVRLKVLAG
jgi:hypothetical protein